MCQQETMKYLNIIRNPVGFLVTFEQLILDLLNLDEPVEKHFQAFILQIKQVAQQEDCNPSKIAHVEREINGWTGAVEPLLLII
jgi:hypothetical protein